MLQQPVADLLTIVRGDQQINAAVAGALRRAAQSRGDRADQDAELADRGRRTQSVATARPAGSQERFQPVGGPEVQLVIYERDELGLGRQQADVEPVPSRGRGALQRSRRHPAAPPLRRGSGRAMIGAGRARDRLGRRG